MFTLEQYTEVFHDTDTHTKPQIKCGFSMTSGSSHGQNPGEMGPAPQGALCRHSGVSEGGQGALTPQTHTTLPLPLPTHSLGAATVLCSQ